MSVPTAPVRSRSGQAAGFGARLGPGPLLAAVFAAVYGCFLTRNYYWDGLSFAIDIEHAETMRDLFNVHHLLYNFIGYGEYVASGRAIRSLYLMQWTNCLAGGVLVWLAYRLFRSLEVPARNSAACAALLGVTATFWKFSTDADSYILANVFLIAAYLTIPRRPLAGGLLHFGALMLHQLSALFYPVGLLLLWRGRRGGFRMAALKYTAASAGLTMAAYATAYRLATHKPAGLSFTGWLGYHAKVPFIFNPLAGVGWLVLGTARLFGGGKLEGIAFAAAAASLAALGWAMVGIVKNRAHLAPVRTAWLLLAWAGVYAGFLLVWEPYNTFYRLFYLTPLIGLLAVSTRAMGPRPLAVMAMALGCWNFFGYIYPNTRVEKNQLLVFALEKNKEWPAGTGVIFSVLVPDLWTISYFNPQVYWIPLEQPDPARVAAYAAEMTQHGGKLYLSWTYLERAGKPASRFQFDLVR